MTQGEDPIFPLSGGGVKSGEGGGSDGEGALPAGFILKAENDRWLI